MIEAVPLADRIIVKRDEAADKIGQFYVPNQAQETPSEATVVAVGPGRILDNGTLTVMSVQVGDRVMIGQFAGTPLKIGGEAVLILREDEVLAILKEKLS